MIKEIKDSFQKFFKQWLAFSYFQNEIKSAHEYIKNLIRENQSALGRIKILEEQQEIMHNFLVEINKYLVKLSERDMKKEDGKKKMKESKKDMKKDGMGKKGCK